MPEFVVQPVVRADPGLVLAAVAELAEGGLAERMRLDAGARVLVTARRMLALAPPEAAAGRSSDVVLRVARSWDPAATTAGEHVESLAPAELDSFLAAAPRWAASVQDTARAKRRAA
jgi:hypothetical protein